MIKSLIDKLFGQSLEKKFSIINYDINDPKLEDKLISDIIEKKVLFSRMISHASVSTDHYYESFNCNVRIRVDFPLAIEGSFSFLYVGNEDASYLGLDILRIVAAINLGQDNGPSTPNLVWM